MPIGSKVHAARAAKKKEEKTNKADRVTLADGVDVRDDRDEVKSQNATRETTYPTTVSSQVVRPPNLVDADQTVRPAPAPSDSEKKSGVSSLPPIIYPRPVFSDSSESGSSSGISSDGDTEGRDVDLYEELRASNEQNEELRKQVERLKANLTQTQQIAKASAKQHLTGDVSQISDESLEESISLIEDSVDKTSRKKSYSKLFDEKNSLYDESRNELISIITENILDDDILKEKINYLDVLVEILCQGDNPLKLLRDDFDRLEIIQFFLGKMDDQSRKDILLNRGIEGLEGLEVTTDVSKLTGIIPSIINLFIEDGVIPLFFQSEGQKKLKYLSVYEHLLVLYQKFASIDEQNDLKDLMFELLRIQPINHLIVPDPNLEVNLSEKLDEMLQTELVYSPEVSILVKDDEKQEQLGKFEIQFLEPGVGVWGGAHAPSGVVHGGAPGMRETEKEQKDLYIETINKERNVVLDYPDGTDPIRTTVIKSLGNVDQKQVQTLIDEFNADYCNFFSNIICELVILEQKVTLRDCNEFNEVINNHINNILKLCEKKRLIYKDLNTGELVKKGDSKRTQVKIKRAQVSKKMYEQKLKNKNTKAVKQNEKINLSIDDIQLQKYYLLYTNYVFFRSIVNKIIIIYRLIYQLKKTDLSKISEKILALPGQLVEVTDFFSYCPFHFYNKNNKQNKYPDDQGPNNHPEYQENEEKFLVTVKSIKEFILHRMCLDKMKNCEKDILETVSGDYKISKIAYNIVLSDLIKIENYIEKDIEEKKLSRSTTPPPTIFDAKVLVKNMTKKYSMEVSELLYDKRRLQDMELDELREIYLNLSGYPSRYDLSEKHFIIQNIRDEISKLNNVPVDLVAGQQIMMKYTTYDGLVKKKSSARALRKMKEEKKEVIGIYQRYEEDRALHIIDFPPEYGYIPDACKAIEWNGETATVTVPNGTTGMNTIYNYEIYRGNNAYDRFRRSAADSQRRTAADPEQVALAAQSMGETAADTTTCEVNYDADCFNYNSDLTYLFTEPLHNSENPGEYIQDNFICGEENTRSLLLLLCKSCALTQAVRHGGLKKLRGKIQDGEGVGKEKYIELMEHLSLKIKYIYKEEKFGNCIENNFFKKIKYNWELTQLHFHDRIKTYIKKKIRNSPPIKYLEDYLEHGHTPQTFDQKLDHIISNFAMAGAEEVVELTLDTLRSWFEDSFKGAATGAMPEFLTSKFDEIIQALRGFIDRIEVLITQCLQFLRLEEFSESFEITNEELNLKINLIMDKLGIEPLEWSAEDEDGFRIFEDSENEIMIEDNEENNGEKNEMVKEFINSLKEYKFSFSYCANINEITVPPELTGLTPQRSIFFNAILHFLENYRHKIYYEGDEFDRDDRTGEILTDGKDFFNKRTEMIKKIRTDGSWKENDPKDLDKYARNLSIKNKIRKIKGCDDEILKFYGYDINKILKEECQNELTPEIEQKISESPIFRRLEEETPDSKNEKLHIIRNNCIDDRSFYIFKKLKSITDIESTKQTDIDGVNIQIMFKKLDMLFDDKGINAFNKLKTSYLIIYLRYKILTYNKDNERNLLEVGIPLVEKEFFRIIDVIIILVNRDPKILDKYFKDIIFGNEFNDRDGVYVFNDSIPLTPDKMLLKKIIETIKEYTKKVQKPSDKKDIKKIINLLLYGKTGEGEEEELINLTDKNLFLEHVMNNTTSLSLNKLDCLANFPIENLYKYIFNNAKIKEKYRFESKHKSKMSMHQPTLVGYNDKECILYSIFIYIADEIKRLKEDLFIFNKNNLFKKENDLNIAKKLTNTQKRRRLGLANKHGTRSNKTKKEKINTLQNETDQLIKYGETSITGDLVDSLGLAGGGGNNNNNNKIKINKKIQHGGSVNCFSDRKDYLELIDVTKKLNKEEDNEFIKNEYFVAALQKTFKELEELKNLQIEKIYGDKIKKDKEEFKKEFQRTLDAYALRGYQKGDQVRIFSKSQGRWVPAKVEKVLKSRRGDAVKVIYYADGKRMEKTVVTENREEILPYQWRVPENLSENLYEIIQDQLKNESDTTNESDITKILETLTDPNILMGREKKTGSTELWESYSQWLSGFYIKSAEISITTEKGFGSSTTFYTVNLNIMFNDINTPILTVVIGPFRYSEVFKKLKDFNSDERKLLSSAAYRDSAATSTKTALDSQKFNGLSLVDRHPLQEKFNTFKSDWMETKDKSNPEDTRQKILKEFFDSFKNNYDYDNIQKLLDWFSPDNTEATEQLRTIMIAKQERIDLLLILLEYINGLNTRAILAARQVYKQTSEIYELVNEIRKKGLLDYILNGNLSEDSDKERILDCMFESRELGSVCKKLLTENLKQAGTPDAGTGKLDLDFFLDTEEEVSSREGVSFKSSLKKDSFKDILESIISLFKEMDEDEKDEIDTDFGMLFPQDKKNSFLLQIQEIQSQTSLNDAFRDSITRGNTIKALLFFSGIYGVVDDPVVDGIVENINQKRIELLSSSNVSGLKPAINTLIFQGEGRVVKSEQLMAIYDNAESPNPYNVTLRWKKALELLVGFYELLEQRTESKTLQLVPELVPETSELKDKIAKLLSYHSKSINKTLYQQLERGFNKFNGDPTDQRTKENLLRSIIRILGINTGSEPLKVEMMREVEGWKTNPPSRKGIADLTHAIYKREQGRDPLPSNWENLPKNQAYLNFMDLFIEINKLSSRGGNNKRMNKRTKNKRRNSKLSNSKRSNNKRNDNKRSKNIDKRRNKLSNSKRRISKRSKNIDKRRNKLSNNKRNNKRSKNIDKRRNKRTNKRNNKRSNSINKRSINKRNNKRSNGNSNKKPQINIILEK